MFQFWITVITVHTECARIDPDCQFACVILSNTNVWTGVGNGSCIYVATKVTKLIDLQKNKIEGTPILKLAMVKRLWVKKFKKKFPKKFSLKYSPASNDAGLGPEADPLFYSIQHKTSHWSKSEKKIKNFF